MTCPACGAMAEDGRVTGIFSFFRPIVVPAHLARRCREGRGRAGSHGRRSALNELLTRGLPSHHSVRVEAEARKCARCVWLNIDANTLTLSRLVHGRLVSNASGALDAPCCPECAGGLDEGHVYATIRFQPDDQARPGFWRGLWDYWLRGVAAKANARCCDACGWIVVDGSSLVEPV